MDSEPQYYLQITDIYVKLCKTHLGRLTNAF